MEHVKATKVEVSKILSEHISKKSKNRNSASQEGLVSPKKGNEFEKEKKDDDRREEREGKEKREERWDFEKNRININGEKSPQKPETLYLVSEIRDEKKERLKDENKKRNSSRHSTNIEAAVTTTTEGVGSEPISPKSHQEEHTDSSDYPSSNTSHPFSNINSPSLSPHRQLNQQLLHLDPLVYLNIGGMKYVVDRQTLCSEPNYFTSVLSGKYGPVVKDRDDYVYINRPGSYFAPILEYLITTEVIVPPNMCERALAREAVFYGIDFPLVETHRSLLFVTDSWLEERFEQRAYFKIAPIADIILGIVLQQFKEKADKSVKMEVQFLMKDNERVNKWLDQTEYGKQYQRFEFIDKQKQLYNNERSTIANDDYFALLESKENQKTIIAYASLNDLSLDIVPISIHEPGVVGRHYFTIGYKIVHLKGDEKPHNYRHSGDSHSSAIASMNRNSKRLSQGNLSRGNISNFQ